MSRIEDKEFHVELPEQKTGGCSFAMVASTRAGKTTMLKHIIEKYFDKHIKLLMSASVHADIYRDIDDCIKIPKFSSRLVKEGYEINRRIHNYYPFLYILDDIVDQKFSKELLKLFTIYRNSGISAIISIQSLKLLNTASRGNINYVLLGKLNSDEAIEQVIRAYLMSYLSGRMEEKIRSYKAITEGHHFIVVDNLTGEVFRTKIRV